MKSIIWLPIVGCMSVLIYAVDGNVAAASVLIAGTLTAEIVNRSHKFAQAQLRLELQAEVKAWRSLCWQYQSRALDVEEWHRKLPPPHIEIPVQRDETAHLTRWG